MPGLPTPDTEPAPVRINPPCPGCPDPENAEMVDMPCSGPEEISGEVTEISESQCRALGGPACDKIIYCPRTRGHRIK